MEAPTCERFIEPHNYVNLQKSKVNEARVVDFSGIQREKDVNEGSKLSKSPAYIAAVILAASANCSRGYRHGACSGTPETAAEGKGRSGRVAPTGEGKHQTNRSKQSKIDGRYTPDRHRRKSAGEAIQETLPTVGDTGVVQ
jgi:hypothetical protein